jgi:predicted DNA-binding protein with PD1-like motif
MKFQQFGDRYQLRLEDGERVAETLLGWLKAHSIGYATMTGLGAVSAAKVSYWNATSREYEPHQLDEQMEVVSLIGNVTIKEGAPFTHIHVTLGRRDLSIVGGHFNDMTVHPNLEIWLSPESEAVERTLDEASGIFLMNLPEEV